MSPGRRGTDRDRSQERVTVARADRPLAQRLGDAGEVRGRLHPDRVLRPAAHRLDRPRLDPELAVGLHHVRGPGRDALQDGAEQVTARVGQVQPEERALRVGVVDGRPLTGEVRQAEEALGALGASLGLRDELLEAWRRPPSSSRNQRMSVPEVARPAIEAWRPGNEPRRVPQPWVADRAFGDLDDEDRSSRT